MNLSRRLLALLENMRGQVLADIGCDHAYLACQAVQSGRFKKAYACDVSKGPLDHARRTIEENHLQSFVFPVLSNGFEQVPEDADTAVIAGMGAETMIEILQAHPFLGKLYLSPHKDASLLRKFLLENGYSIRSESYIKDGHFYPVLEVVPGSMELSEVELEWGKNVKENPDYFLYLDYEKKKLEKILGAITKEKPQKLVRKLELLNQRLSELNTRKI